jgi:hypothetical protein
MSKIVWESSVTQEMMDEAGLDPADVKAIVKELDDAVMEICLSHGLS